MNAIICVILDIINNLQLYINIYMFDALNSTFNTFNLIKSTHINSLAATFVLSTSRTLIPPHWPPIPLIPDCEHKEQYALYFINITSMIHVLSINPIDGLCYVIVTWFVGSHMKICPFNWLYHTNTVIAVESITLALYIKDYKGSTQRPYQPNATLKSSM